MKWQTDTRAEEVLTKMDVAFTLKTVPASKINTKASRVNRARAIPINKEVAEDFSLSMNEGDTFPSIVLVKINDAKTLVIAGGNHRHEAAVVINGEKSVLALVCQTDDIVFDLLCKALNRVEGVRPDRATLVTQAVEAIFRYGYTVKDAASHYRVPESIVRAGYRAEQVRNRMIELGVTPKESVPKGHLDLFYRFLKHDVVLAAFAKILASPQCPTNEKLKEIRDEVEKQANEADRLEVITRLAKVSKRPKGKPKGPARVQDNMTRLENTVMEAKTRQALQISEPDREEFKKRWNKLNDHMQNLLDPPTDGKE